MGVKKSESHSEKINVRQGKISREQLENIELRFAEVQPPLFKFT